MVWLRCMNFFLWPDTKPSTQPSCQHTLDGRQKWQPAANHTMDISKETMQKFKKSMPHTLDNWITGMLRVMPGKRRLQFQQALKESSDGRTSTHRYRNRCKPVGLVWNYSQNQCDPMKKRHLTFLAIEVFN